MLRSGRRARRHCPGLTPDLTPFGEGGVRVRKLPHALISDPLKANSEGSENSDGVMIMDV